MYPLQLKNYFFIKQDVEPIPNFDIEKETVFTHSVISIIDEIQENDEIHLTVELKLNEEKSKNISYKYHLKTYGIFKINRDYPPQSQNKDFFINVAKENATSLLIGAMRERLLSLVSVGPWPSFILDFIPMNSIIYFMSDRSQVKEIEKKENNKKSKSKSKKAQ